MSDSDEGSEEPRVNRHPTLSNKNLWRIQRGTRCNGNRTGRRYSHLRRAEARARKGR